ncbi:MULTISPECIES: ABC transporter ATP-binding protein [unclassified Sedimentibacter]|uniref:ABC transporter ATP-binding protein n=1 Tax=unclassified Sedimentibacter TaxID=2649220 RepID=UPI0027E1D2D6|nr:sn-glycerol-3-phosphate ABC transporter ATP-binding protein UgpC [Sedimentibacter sp. MB35-C1]WMJ78697.1 sn-glycerol-3-phosphate ABC transporter ATP-binding protein UgpC [Sedimentibacter sp. MB35-C1]
MANLSLNHVYKEYPCGFAAVSDFCLEVADREFIVLVGPSGCGKSTTLRMISGLEEISKGELYINGRMVNKLAPKDRNIAMVFQNYALYSHMTVFDNMAFALKIHNTSKNEIKRRVEETANMLGILSLMNRMPKSLSGGQKQRVALGRALVCEFEVFLFDEPLSNLDAKLRGQMRTELIRLHKKLNTTFIYVTHDQTEALTMGDRIVVMKDGFIQQVGTPQELYYSPCNLFVAGFIGSPSMNFINGILTHDESRYYITIDSKGHSCEIKLPEDISKDQSIKGYIRKEVVMGIRPENVYVDGSFVSGSDADSITCHVDIAETMGADSFLHLSFGNNIIIARTSSHTDICSGDTIKVQMDGTQIHIFDKKTGKAIL